jgi:DNA-binding NtrC family response regulator
MKILEAHHWPGNVRELRNLVESMVVLAPGHEIMPADIPPEVRGVGGALVPALVPRSVEGNLRPELEFIFRTLVEMRVDMDDLRSEFEAYREDLSMAPTPSSFPVELRIASTSEPPPPEGDVHKLPLDEHGVVVYRSGMTMEDLERAAVLAALQEKGGNRRRAAETLGIGERTLYRKIKEYDLEL